MMTSEKKNRQKLTSHPCFSSKKKFDNNEKEKIAEALKNGIGFVESEDLLTL